jgi:methylenetetrahydrofolate reductase (NADPH)
LLALRGDLPAGWEGTRGDFSYANELIAFIRSVYGDKFTIAMAGAPEKHIQARSFEEDIAHLRMKQDCGADYMMTQLCFDIEAYKRWYDMVRKAGITIPIDVGVRPVLNKDATIRMALSMNGCSNPAGWRKLLAAITTTEGSGSWHRVYGQQICEYVSLGIDGLQSMLSTT